MSSGENPWKTDHFELASPEGLSVSPVITYRGPVHPSGRHMAGAHPFYTWWWIDRGEVTVVTRGETVRVVEREWVFIPAGLWREQRFAEATEIISINFQALWQEQLPLIRGTAPLMGKWETAPGLVEAAEGVMQALVPMAKGIPSLRSMPLERRFEMAAALYRFVNLLFANAVSRGASIMLLPSPDARMEWVVRDLHSNLRAGPLPFARWQERTGLSRSQLERLARRYLGRTLHAYRDELLASAASRALTTERPLVKQVAEQFGFVDTAHFCRWLRAHTGRTPAVLQRAAVV